MSWWARTPARRVALVVLTWPVGALVFMVTALLGLKARLRAWRRSRAISVERIDHDDERRKDA